VALLSVSNAAKVTRNNEIKPLSYHWNEDPRSVPNPIRGATQMSSTKAKYLRQKQDENASEPPAIPGRPYNHYDDEPTGQDSRFYFYAQQKAKAQAKANEEDTPEDDTTVLWRVTPDRGDSVPNNEMAQLESDSEDDYDEKKGDEALT